MFLPVVARQMRCEVFLVDICVVAVWAVDQTTHNGDRRVHVAVRSERYMLVFGKFNLAAFISRAQAMNGLSQMAAHSATHSHSRG